MVPSLVTKFIVIWNNISTNSLKAVLREMASFFTIIFTTWSTTKKNIETVPLKKQNINILNIIKFVIIY